MKSKTMDCEIFQNALPDLLLDPAALASQAARAHLTQCVACTQQLASFEATLSLLDDWQAPEVSPYFDQKLAVRLREAQTAPAAGWLERLRVYLQLNTGRHLRPAIAGCLALALVVGGGGVGLVSLYHPQPVEASATVHDLQNFDKNVQALQQMDQLLQEDAPVNGNSEAPPQS